MAEKSMHVLVVNHAQSPECRLPQKSLPSSSSLQPTFHQLLTPSQHALLSKELLLLGELTSTLEKIKPRTEDLEALRASINQLQQLFLLVVVGEFNSGKSSFLNALLGKRYLDDGVTPTTSKIDLLQYGEKVDFEVVPETAIQRKVSLPVPWLQEISLVDTPGTNAIYRHHQTLTEHFVPRCDLVLWVTSADRAFSESERKFLETVEKYQKKVVVVISKIDILNNSKDLEEIQNFVKTNFFELARVEPIIFPVSARLALEAKTSGEKESQAWLKSRFGDLENYIFQTLSSTERASIKFENPLGVGEHLLEKYLEEARGISEILEEDVEILKKINAEHQEFKADLIKNFAGHLDRIDNVLYRLSERAQDFFDEKITITNAWALTNVDQIKKDFETEVVGKASVEIDGHVGDVVDWLLKRNAKQWQNTTDYIIARSRSKGDFQGKITPAFDYDRTKVLTGLGDSAKKVVDGFDQQKEAEYLSNSIRAGVYRTAVIEVSAVGGGILLTSLLDISGLLPAAGLAITGLGVLPYVRYTLKNNLHKQIALLRQRMKETLTTHFHQQLEEGMQKISDNIKPYERFIADQAESVKVATQDLKTTKAKFADLKQEIRREFSAKK